MSRPPYTPTQPGEVPDEQNVFLRHVGEPIQEATPTQQVISHLTYLRKTARARGVQNEFLDLVHILANEVRKLEVASQQHSQRLQARQQIKTARIRRQQEKVS